MTGYIQVNLQDMINDLGEEKTEEIIKSFECPLNKDVEDFLKYKAVEFSRQSLSKTYLVFASYKSAPVLCGYYTVANKFIHIERSNVSKTLQKRISKFAQYDVQAKKYVLSALLIAQLGKNYNNGYNKLITGDELLKMACDRVKNIQYLVGGKICYIECEDEAKLIEFYSDNGFVNFGHRELEQDETNTMRGNYLVQMLCYCK